MKDILCIFALISFVYRFCGKPQSSRPICDNPTAFCAGGFDPSEERISDCVPWHHPWNELSFWKCLDGEAFRKHCWPANHHQGRHSQCLFVALNLWLFGRWYLSDTMTHTAQGPCTVSEPNCLTEFSKLCAVLEALYVSIQTLFRWKREKPHASSDHQDACSF